jgi:hypothetical protein
LHANGYRPEYLDKVSNSRRSLLSAFGFAATVARLKLLTLGHPRAIQPAFLREPQSEGERFAQVAGENNLTILENWALDYAAHRQQDSLDERFIELDRFLYGFLNASPKASLVLTSDHGNAEESWHTQHTCNPVPLIVHGWLASTVPTMRNLTDVAPWMHKELG